MIRLALFCLLGLAGCAGQAEPRVVLRPCSPLPVREYTPAQQDQMADELESRPNHPLLGPMEELRQWRLAGRVLHVCW